MSLIENVPVEGQDARQESPDRAHRSNPRVSREALGHAAASSELSALLGKMKAAARKSGPPDYDTRIEHLDPKGQNIYVETAASGTPNAGTAGQNGIGLLQQGFVETSNVNVVEELVGMIQTQRAYELNSKAIKTSDDMLARLTQL